MSAYSLYTQPEGLGGDRATADTTQPRTQQCSETLGLFDEVPCEPEAVVEVGPAVGDEKVVQAFDVEATDTDPQQVALFDLDELDWWREYWVGMPEFLQEDLTPWKSIAVHFQSRSDLAQFAELVGQPFTDKTRSVWFPSAEIGRYSNKRFADE